jgi:hypothetical protein
MTLLSLSGVEMNATFTPEHFGRVLAQLMPDGTSSPFVISSISFDCVVHVDRPAARGQYAPPKKRRTTHLR